MKEVTTIIIKTDVKEQKKLIKRGKKNMKLFELQDAIYEIIISDKTRKERIDALDKETSEMCGIAEGQFIADVYCTICSYIAGFINGYGYKVLENTENGYFNRNLSLGEALNIELDTYYNISLNKALRGQIDAYFKAVEKELELYGK